EIAWLLMQFGDWQCDGPKAVVAGNELAAIEFIWTPIEQQNAGFEMIGTLSSMFARFYAEQTLDEAGVAQIEARSKPGWLAPLHSRAKAAALPLWKFILEPSPQRRLPVNSRSAVV